MCVYYEIDLKIYIYQYYTMLLKCKTSKKSVLTFASQIGFLSRIEMFSLGFCQQLDYTFSKHKMER